MTTRNMDRRPSVCSDSTVGPVTRTRNGILLKPKFVIEEDDDNTATKVRSRRSSVISSARRSKKMRLGDFNLIDFESFSPDVPNLLMGYLLDGEEHDQDVPSFNPCQDEDDENVNSTPKKMIKIGPNQFDDEAIPESVYRAITKEFDHLHPWVAQGLRAKWYIDVSHDAPVAPTSEPLEVYQQVAAVLRDAIAAGRVMVNDPPADLKRKAPKPGSAFLPFSLCRSVPAPVSPAPSATSTPQVVPSSIPAAAPCKNEVDQPTFVPNPIVQVDSAMSIVSTALFTDSDLGSALYTQPNTIDLSVLPPQSIFARRSETPQSSLRSLSPQVVPLVQTDEQADVDIESLSPQDCVEAVPWRTVRGRLPLEARTQLHRWFVQHLTCTAANKADIANLVALTGMNRRQVRGWLSHARKRFATVIDIAERLPLVHERLVGWLTSQSVQSLLTSHDLAELSAVTQVDSVVLSNWMEQARTLISNAGAMGQSSTSAKLSWEGPVKFEHTHVSG